MLNPNIAGFLLTWGEVSFWGVVGVFAAFIIWLEIKRYKRR